MGIFSWSTYIGEGEGGRGVYFRMKLCVSKAYGGLFRPIQFFVKTRGGLTELIKYRSAASARKTSGFSKIAENNILAADVVTLSKV